MDAKEFGKFAMALRTYYPKENLLPNQQAAELWYKQISDIPYDIAETVLNKWVALNKWSPTIADIREQAAGLTQKPIKDWGDAWDDVRMAVRLYGSYQQKEAMDSLDELTRECVKRVGYINICMSENIATERANFRMIYNELANRKKEDAQIPERLKQAIGRIGIEKNINNDYQKFKAALEELGKELDQ